MKPKNDKYHKDGELVVDAMLIDFWDISDDFYHKADGIFPSMLIPSFAWRQVKQKMAEHYLHAAMKRREM